MKNTRKHIEKNETAKEFEKEWARTKALSEKHRREGKEDLAEKELDLSVAYFYAYMDAMYGA